ncbi:hypothetical protein H4217_000128 [Coemansia sp. RSA 1939]|nr:hypothetical protein H4217_000128 [Coemansia sp. RSA 1939]KAJ2617971.1 hypothetical protein EV177_000281 [Coemansia sp. RSA 1804]KAJ2694097.1 hypothetical protein GGH99_000834 [Coemansia sp. RSA 1285]
MSSSFVIACVGKPSAGKSSFLNAVTDASAKVGNFPFTTIEPNQGIAYYPVDCPCRAAHAAKESCKPRYGWCADGRRFVPVRLLDVAGLVPGASEGRGLGNKFLDDLRQADVLIHVVDASGTTDDNGRETKGYDPVGDIQWLRKEIEDWVFGNMERRWGGIVRRHIAVKASIVDTMHAQLAGYGTVRSIVQRAVDQLHARFGSMDLDKWDMERVRDFVRVFLDERFPTVVALNKIDMPDADKNIAAIVRRYRGPDPRDGVRAENIVLTSALSECFLRKMAKQRIITYAPGDAEFSTDAPGLRPADERTQRRLDNISDLVLFRYGSTGVQDVIVRAVEVRGFVPVFPVKSFSVFPECILVRPGTTVREFARRLHSDIDRAYAGAETVGAIQLAEDDAIVAGKNNIIRFM